MSYLHAQASIQLQGIGNGVDDSEFKPGKEWPFLNLGSNRFETDPGPDPKEWMLDGVEHSIEYKAYGFMLLVLKRVLRSLLSGAAQIHMEVLPSLLVSNAHAHSTS